MENFPNEPNDPNSKPEDGQLDLWNCGICTDGLVYPVEWCEAGPTSWEMTCHCPNCDNFTTSIYSDDEAELMDGELNRSFESIAEDLIRLQSVKLEDIVELIIDGEREPELPIQMLDLSHCDNCQGNFVQVTADDISQRSPNYYEATCHCPDCGNTTNDIYHEQVIDMLGEKLSDGQISVVKDLALIDKANQEDSDIDFSKLLD
jgi:hypothetical protein